MTTIPDKSASPRCYSRHQRYARLKHLRYAAQKMAWLNKFAKAFSPETAAQVYDFLFTNSAYTISQVGVSGDAVTTKAGLKADDLSPAGGDALDA